MSPRITLVAAMARGNVIGIDNTLPWHLPEDLRSAAPCLADSILW